MRGGDLRFDYFGSIRAVEGIRAHQKVQRQRPEGYQAEVPVAYATCLDDIEVAVSGRIDGLFERDGRTVVEEIKSSRSTAKEIEVNPNPLHWGQAKCYAFMWASQNGEARMDVQLTYVNPQNGRLHEVVETFDFETLTGFFEDLLDRYVSWIKTVTAWRRSRNRTLEKMVFPFKRYRQGQRAVAVEVYRTLRDGGHLFVQAATGIGKTMAVLFPAFKALAGGFLPKVIFLTARTTGRMAAEASLDILRQQGAAIKSVSLTAKDKICFKPDAACTPEECEYARGFFDRVNAAVAAVFEAGDAFTRTVIETAAREHRVCPFEFSLELVNWADCVIGDYNYAFDPTVTLRRLFVESGDAHVLLIDEAHNLVDRSRDMFSAVLTKSPVLSLRRDLKKELPGLYRDLGRINSWMASARRNCLEAGGELVGEIPPEDLLERIQTFLFAAERWLAKNRPTPFRESLLRLFFDFTGFIRVADQYDSAYATISESDEKEYRIKLLCMDPASQLRDVWQRCRAAVFFSATLSPPGYFQAVLGCCDETRRINIGSPFPPSHLSVCAATSISTYFKQRKASCEDVCRVLGNLVCQRKGNYLLFFPSYAYLKMVYDRFTDMFGNFRCMTQTVDMDEEQREVFLGQFNETVTDTLVGFAVMGGIFGEGIDLRGDRLSGVAIVGVGLPGICAERDLIRNHYQRLYGRGFEYAYQYPGMIRVIQAAGRVIRSASDKGVILLVDSRYGQKPYRELLPGYWRLTDVAGADGLQDALNLFWNKEK